MRNKPKLAAILPKVRLFWLGTCVSISIVMLYEYSVGFPGRFTRLFFIIMAVLTFPAGVVGYISLQLFELVLLYGFRVDLPASYLSLLLSWLSFSIPGYVQWFIFVPRLIGRRLDIQHRRPDFLLNVRRNPARRVSTDQ